MRLDLASIDFFQRSKIYFSRFGNIKRLKKKGVKIRIAAPFTKDNKKALTEVSKFAEIRNTTSSARFCIVDGKELVFMVMDDKDVHPTYDVGIWVNTPFYASAMESMFDLAWKGMKKS